MSAFHILDDCPACGVESAVLALFDPAVPATLLGVAAESRCRLCGRTTHGVVTPDCASPDHPERYQVQELCPACGTRLDEEERLANRCGHCGLAAVEREVRAGRRFHSLEDLGAAMARWARTEGYDTAEEFLETSFSDGDLSAVLRRMRAGEAVETNFDVLAFLFPEVALAAAVSPVEAGGEPGEIGSPASPPPPAPGGAADPAPDARGGASASMPGGPDPSTGGATRRRVAGSGTGGDAHRAWQRLLPLVSVMVADGRVHPAEEAFLTRVLAHHRLPPIPSDLVRVHRPEAVEMPETLDERERLLEAMVHLVHVDRQRDGTEFRVVQEYARAWRVDDALIAHWDRTYRGHYATGLRRLWLILQAAFLRS